MKGLIFILSALSCVSAFAQPGADIYMTRIVCDSVEKYPDFSTTVKVLEGGVTGIPQIEISESTIHGVSTKRYLAKRLFSDRIGAPVVYQAPGISLSINFTTSPVAGAFHPATLATQDRRDSAPQYQQFQCRMIGRVSNRAH